MKFEITTSFLTRVCHYWSTAGADDRGIMGVCLSACWDTTPPGSLTPPWTRHPTDQAPPRPRRLPEAVHAGRYFVNERAVCILLECNLVKGYLQSVADDQKENLVLFRCQYTLCIVSMWNLQLDTDEMTVENAITRSFDKIVKLHLDPVWHQLSSKTKQLIADIKTLKLMLE